MAKIKQAPTVAEVVTAAALAPDIESTISVLRAASDEKLQEQKAIAAAAPRVDRKDRHDFSYSPEARKARELIKTGEFNNLPGAVMVVREFMPPPWSERLEQVFEQFAVAHQEWVKLEERAPNTVTAWLGDDMGELPPLPAEQPKHRHDLQWAWKDMLRVMNELTVVGVKRQRTLYGMQVVLRMDIDGIVPPSPAETFQFG